METYFECFHENEHISENPYFPAEDEIINDQLSVLESIKAEENNDQQQHFQDQYLVGKEDFHQIMTDWQQHVGLLQSIETEDLALGLGMGLDSSNDPLNTFSTADLFEEKESSILSKALKSPMQKSLLHQEATSKVLAVNDSKKELIIENFNSSENCQKLCELIKTENSLLGKVMFLNGEKEIMGKNIVGLHCLNEIRENPDENCQVTSTVINGKRYKIIIKPKSLKVKKLSNEKIKKTLIKKLLQCNLVTKPEPKEDEIISEMRNGNYDVPILGNDVLPSWDLVNLDSDWNKIQLGNESDTTANEPEPETVKKISPLRIKVPKLKKNKKQNCLNKSDEEVDVETLNEKVVEGSTLGNLLNNFEQEISKLHNEKTINVDEDKMSQSEDKKFASEAVIDSLPKQVVEKIETLKQKRDCRIPLIQAIPSKKVVKCCTRMQDAVATMNRNKLLKIVSGGDTISLDHDYCSTFNKKSLWNKQVKKSNCLLEKNPKKDSGMESGDVSDTSEGPNTPETSQINQFNSVSTRLMQDTPKQKTVNDSEVPSTENKVFLDVPTSLERTDVNISDLVKTETVSNGNKALTNTETNVNCNSGFSVPSENLNNCEKESENKCEIQENGEENIIPLKKSEFAQNERPKRKLKLEEYLSRRNINKEKNGNLKESSALSDTVTAVGLDSDKLSIDQSNVDPGNTECSKTENCPGENSSEKVSENTDKKLNLPEEKDKKYSRERSRRSSSVSSEGRKEYRGRNDSRLKSRSHWRSDSSNSRTRDRRENHRSRWSTSRDRKADFWSDSSSGSASRESSTSSDYGSRRRSRNSSRYRRRSRSRSSSRGRSRSRNRDYSNRSRFNTYYRNKNSTSSRSRSPFYAYSMREKQRQIEERRVIYVGRIEEGMTNAKLRKRFSIFGPIIDISLHFREYGDNYGFVTYAYKADAYDAVEHGNDDPSLPHYDLCFGGRRGFCKEKYADLDGMPTSYSGFRDAPIFRGAKDSFDMLLKEAQAKLKNRKKQ